jgi:hypothetical protein
VHGTIPFLTKEKPVSDQIPAEIEAQAIEIFHQHRKRVMGCAGDWKEAGEDVQDRFHLKAFLANYKAPL